jgi:hypothetical protein
MSDPKEDLMHRMRLTLLLVFVVMVAWPLLAADAFTITVPNRVNGAEPMPISRIRLTLETDATIDATATLQVIQGATNVVLNLDPMTYQAFGVADSIQFRQDGNDPTHRVHVDFYLRHLMDDPLNFCVLQGGAPPSWMYNFTFNGPEIKRFRIGSYGPALFGPPISAAPCQHATRRIFTSAASTSLTGAAGKTSLGRLPQDIVLVLDNSGSMLSEAPGSPDESRMDVLDASARAFLAMWENEAQSIGGTSLSSDRIGLVFFSTNLTIPFVGDEADKTKMVKRDVFTAPAVDHPWNEMDTAIKDETPDAMTAIGKGLNSAFKTIKNPPTNNDPVIVLMTDGIQNEPPLVEKTGDVLSLDGTELATQGIPILTVALGVGGGINEELLDDIALQTAGRSRVAATSVGTATAFAGQLVTALLGDTLLVATEGEDALATAVLTSAPIQIPLDGSVQRAVFTLGWPTALRDALDLEILPPGVTTPIVPARVTRESNWLVYGVDIPGSGPAGMWQIRVRRGHGGSNVPASVPYHFGAYTYEGKLDFSGMLPPVKRRTGDPITVTTEVGFAGAPVTNAAGKITLRVARPGESIGNLLHDLDVPQNVLDTPTTGDATTPYDRKVKFLEDTLVKNVAPNVVSTSVPLQHRGNGIYSATFTDTSEAGNYKFLLVYDFDAPDGGGRIRRIEQLERMVKVMPDADASEVVVTATDPPGTYVVRVTPKDRFGNYLGPGAPGRISVSVNGIGTVSALADPKQTGDYVATVSGVPAGNDPDVVVKVDEVVVTVDNGPGSTASGSWRFFFDAGINFPDSALDGSFSVNAGIERMLTSHWSIEGILGYHTFDAPLVDVDAWQVSANAKYFFGTGPLRPFLNGGVGVYRIDPPDDTSFGWNTGGGLLYEISAKWAVEGVYNYHSTDPVDWSTLQIGLRWRF